LKKQETKISWTGLKKGGIKIKNKELKSKLNILEKSLVECSVPITNWHVQYANHIKNRKYKFVSEIMSVPENSVLSFKADTLFLTVTLVPPEDFKGKRIYIDIDIGTEGLLFLNNVPLHGIDSNRGYILLDNQCGEKYHLKIIANKYDFEKNEFKDIILKKSNLLTINEEVKSFYYDLITYYELTRTIKNELTARIKKILTESLSLINLNSIPSSIKKAQKLFKNKIAMLPVCNKGTVILVGHSHIDVAWLWPIKETIRKCIRTFSSTLNLMEQFPDYTFAQSQPLLYSLVKKYAPDVYIKVKEKIKQKKWEPVGGMWVECDCNLICGESIVRQFLYGTQFYKQEFGLNTKTCWLPDAFGFPGSLPQILKKCGIENFLTYKLNWNDTNQFPYNLFYWEGIDSSTILTFIGSPPSSDNNTPDFEPFSDYNGDTGPKWINAYYNHYKNKRQFKSVLITYGFGDGGGGPTSNMLEKLKRVKNLPCGVKAVPGFVEEYFENVRKSECTLPVVKGELYLEYHRGTYTSQAKIKKYNRQAELKLRDAEILSSIAEQFEKIGTSKCGNAWKLLLMNQFHDILPGTSINQVYVKAEKDYKKILKIGDQLISKAFNVILKNISTTSPSIIVFNTLSFTRTDIVRLNIDLKYNFEITENGKKINYHIINKSCNKKEILFIAHNVPPLGYKTFKINKVQQPVSCNFKSKSLPFPYEIENIFFKIRFTESGYLSRIFDKMQKKEILRPSQHGNVFEIYYDKPEKYDAWNIDKSHLQTKKIVSDLKYIKLVENNKIRQVIELFWVFNHSAIKQYIIFYEKIPRIDFQTEINWHETHKLLKVCFPINLTTDKAVFEIPFGNISRSNYNKSSIEKAQYEVCTHKWLDISDGNYGVSLINDCKYGCSVKNSNIRLTLLKSSTYPDKKADKGFHSFTYSLYPHKFDFRKGGTVRQAYSLNAPFISKLLEAEAKNFLPESHSFFQIKPENILIETIKKPEDNDGLIIRLYEYYGLKTQAILKSSFEINTAFECDLLEENKSKVNVYKNSFIKFTILPYEIKTFRLK